MINQTELKSIEIAFDQIKLEQELGDGGFGVVYRATYLEADVAVKQLKQKTLTSQVKEEFITETHMMSQLRSPFIVQLYGISTNPYSIVMEYMPKGSLFHLIHSKEELPWARCYAIGIDVGKGIYYLHTQKIVHRDLKSLNVLLDDRYRAKLCDFGLAKVKTLSSSTQTNSSVGTLAWMAPECLKPKAVASYASDIYSYGMVLWEIASRRIPFEEAHGNQALIAQWLLSGACEEIPEETPQPMKEVIQSCWQAEPTKRPTASQVIEQLQSGFEALQLQSLSKYPDNFSSQVMNLPSKVTQPSNSSLSSGPNYPDNFTSTKASLSHQQPVISKPQYIDNFVSQNKTATFVSGPQYLPNTDINTTADLKTTPPGTQPSVSEQTAPSEPMFLTPSIPVKSTLPVLNLEDTPDNLVQMAQALIRGRNWTTKQKAYFQNLIETLSLPPLQTLTGHSERVTSLLLLPSGKVVSGSFDKTLKMWDMKTGQCVKTLTGHSNSVTCLMLLPSEEMVSGSFDKTLKVWDIKTGQCVKTFQGHSDNVNCLLLLPTGEVVSGSEDKTLKVWDMKTGQCVKTLIGHSYGVRSLVLLPSEEMVSGSYQELKVWDRKTGQCVKTLLGHSSSVWCLLLLPSGEVVSGSGDCTLKVWDMKTGQCVKTLSGHTDGVRSLRFISPNVLISSTLREIKYWDLSQYTCVHTYRVMQGAVYDVWPLSATECLLALGPTFEHINWQPYDALHHALTQSTQSLAYASYGFFKHSFRRHLKQLPSTLAGHNNRVTSLGLLPSDEVVSGSSDDTLKVWDMKTGQCVKTLTGHSDTVTSLLLLPSGEVVSGSHDKTLKVWDMKTGQCVKTLKGHSSYVTCLLLLPSGEVVSGSSYLDKTLKVWDVKTGQCVKTLTEHSWSVNCLLLLPNGKVVSGSNDKTLKVWDMKTGQCVKTFVGHSDSVTSLLLLPSGEVVSGSEDKTLKVWDMKTGQCVKTLVGHSDSVTSLLLLPSGEVVSGSEDNALKVWNMKTGQCVKTLTGHERSVHCLLLLPSGEVVSGSQDNTLKVWDIHLEKILEELEEKAPECKQM